MKNLIGLSVLFSFLFLFIAYSQNKISASDAKNHIGKNAIVKGTIIEVYYSRSGTCFLDI